MTKIRNPIQGLRNKVRTYLRENGVEGKFRTQVNRDKTISIFGDVSNTDIKEFEGYKLKYGSLEVYNTPSKSTMKIK